MRANLRDVARDRSWSTLSGWWADLPMRRRAWWRLLLLEDGQGWLRWHYGHYERFLYDPPDVDDWPTAPPLRRAYLFVRSIVMHPIGVARGWWAWREWPSWSDVGWMTDPDRRRHLTER